ncbi:unnamed protein product [Spirodela intermedia]|uniref:Uncharacterized protein n=1 Tax=Spirodela intermedia TaxID=51605 RepID=A0A7I8K418_SPIIN|nr:unnamed protein product [Spirodela intermedia]
MTASIRATHVACAASMPSHRPSKSNPALMFAPARGLALPRSTPQPVVCGQLPSSQRPMIGSTAAVSPMMLGSAVNMAAHECRTDMAKPSAVRPSTKLQERPTRAEVRALLGRLAPSSFPTRVETPKLREEGKMYMKAVVWMRIPMEATVALGLASSPQRSIMISYHHHSRQTEIQLGTARLSRDLQPWKTSAVSSLKPPVRWYTPEKWT